MRWLVVLVAVAGCDKLFSVDHITVHGGEQGMDGGDGDARPVDSPDLDADLCTMMPDEDGDGVSDICDACPTVNNTNPANADSDELPDACDPRPTTPGDRIVFKALFTTVDDEALFMFSGSHSYNGAPINHGIETLGAAGTPSGMQTNDPFTPIKIEVNVAGFTSATTNDEVGVGTSAVKCFVNQCSLGTCFVMIPGNGAGNISSQPSSVSQISIRAAGGLVCTVTGNGSSGSTSNSGFGFAPIIIGTLGDAVVPVKSIVVYGT
jgi:hypothetical protein